MADFWDDQGTLTTIKAQTLEKMICINLTADRRYRAGHWLGLAPIPYDRTLEALESRLGDKSGFLRFIRRTLTWMPEQRPTAKELLRDPWLTGKQT